jgi:hypothetical protein
MIPVDNGQICPDEIQYGANNDTLVKLMKYFFRRMAGERDIS